MIRSAVISRHYALTSIALASVLTPVAAKTQQSANAAPGVIDPGYAEFRQLVDVNNDKLLDYCRFVGTSPSIFLSCQLSKVGGGFVANPYGFSAAAGADLGSDPRLIFNIGDGVGPAFCRYLERKLKPVEQEPITKSSGQKQDVAANADLTGVGLRRPGEVEIPAEDVAYYLSCLQSTKTGFAVDKEFGPDTSRRDKKKVTLLEGADSQTVELVYGGKDGQWIASIRDKSGRHWRLIGLSSYYTAGKIFDTNLRLVTDEDVHGVPFTAAFLKKYPQANLAASQDLQIAANGFVSYGLTGNSEFDPTATPPYTSSGFTYMRESLTPGSKVLIWDGCQPASTVSPGTPYVGTLNNDGSVKWNGATPPSLDACIPGSLKLLNDYSQVFHFLNAQTSLFIRTGDPDIDGKDVLALTYGQIETVIASLNTRIAQAKNGVGENQAALTSEGEAAVGILNAIGNAVKGIAGAGVTFGGAVALVPGGAGIIPGAGFALSSAIFGFVGTMLVDGSVVLVKYLDANNCKKLTDAGYKVPDGCGDTKPVVK